MRHYLPVMGLRSTFIVLAVSLICHLVPAVADAQLPNSSEVELSRELDSPPATATKVLVPLINGTASQQELFQAVAHRLHWIAGAVAGFSNALNTDAEFGERLPAEVVEQLVIQFPSVFAYHEPGEENQGATTESNRWLAVDPDGLASLLADKKSRLRNSLAALQAVPLSRLHRVKQTWTSVLVAPPRIIVTMSGIHGIESNAEAVALGLHDQTNLPAFVFVYPNDAPLAESAKYLQVHLEELHRRYPRSQVTLVAHSLGGIIARSMLELSDADNAVLRSGVATRTGVDQLIQICPPNHGSALSDYAPLLEGVEQFSRLVNRSGNEQRLLMRMITDGFNEAAEDLNPRAQIYRDLDSVGRNLAVKYSIIAGSDGPLGAAAPSLLNAAWSSIADLLDNAPELDQRVRDVVNCAELQKGRGDGVVALESARLSGVDDFEILKIHHLTWSQLDKPAGQEMLRAISRRLGIAL